MPAPAQSGSALKSLSASSRSNFLAAQHSAQRVRVLVIEDDPPVRDACLEVAAEMGFETASAGSVGAAREVLPQPVDIILLDLKLPGGNGLVLLDEIRSRHPSVTVIIMTAFATVDSAVEALRLGAGDYLAKPFTLEQLAATLERVAERRSFDVEARVLRERLRSGRGEGRLTGRSPNMEKLYRILSKVAFTTHPVLIMGESGTGKGVVAETIHLNGPRAAEPFTAVDCSTLDGAAIEARLFGSARSKGLLAGEGTVVVDEVSAMPLELQARLARALETRQVRSADSAESAPLTARLLAATSRDLMQLVETGRFRKDLFYRLNVVNLRIPALRERKEDIPLLTASILERSMLEKSKGERTADVSIAEDAIRMLVDYEWPGNVRELEQALERGMALSSGPVLHLGDLPTQLQNARVERDQRAELQDVAPALSVQVRSIAQMERQAILATLRQLDGDKMKAARLLGIGKTTLYRKLKEYGVSDEDL
jgi:two-component system response regulator HydG